jgi:hypothetical protein
MIRPSFLFTRAMVSLALFVKAKPVLTFPPYS